MDKRKRSSLHKKYALNSKTHLLEKMLGNESDDSTSEYFINATKRRKVHESSYMRNLDNNPRVNILNVNSGLFFGGAAKTLRR